MSIAWYVNVATVKMCGLTEHSAISLIWQRASAMTKRPSASVFPIRTLVPDFAVITSSETYEFSPTLFLTMQRAATAFTVGGWSKFTTCVREHKIHKIHNEEYIIYIISILIFPIFQQKYHLVVPDSKRKKWRQKYIYSDPTIN